MKNLAGVETCDSDILAELQAAGIDAYRVPFIQSGEVPSKVMGILASWTFKRAWYYWVCEGRGLPPESARRLYETNRVDVRVGGHCACPSPDEWCGGFAVGLYHVDSQEGLIALANEIRAVRLANIRLLGQASKWVNRQTADDAYRVARNDVAPLPPAPTPEKPS